MNHARSFLDLSLSLSLSSLQQPDVWLVVSRSQFRRWQKLTGGIATLEVSPNWKRENYGSIFVDVDGRATSSVAQSLPELGNRSTRG